MHKHCRLFITLASLSCIFLLQESHGAYDPSSHLVESFDVYPTDVRINSTPEVVTFKLVLADDKSGSQLFPLKEIPKAVIKSPRSYQILPVVFTNISNLVYKGTVELDKETAEGKWQLYDLRLTDSQENIRDLTNELIDNKFPTVFYVRQKGLGLSYGLALLISLLVLLLMAGLYYLLSGYQSPMQIYKSDDGGSSASKAQFLIWTIVTIFSYTLIYSDRVINHNSFDTLSTIPSNLLLAMGLSAGTTVAAKLVTGTKTRSGKIQTQTNNTKGGIFLSEDGEPDLSRIQMMAWTLLASGIYIFTVWEIVRTSVALPELPDINTTLLALMGIGQGAYVGKKIVTTDDPKAPRISTISPQKGTIESDIILTGLNFGDTQGGSRILFDGKPVPEGDDTEWSNTRIKIKIPSELDGEKLAPRKTEVSLIVRDMECPSPKAFELIDGTDPYLYGVNPKKESVGKDVVLTGFNFGDVQGGSRILIDGKPIQDSPPPEWSNFRIKFQIPSEYKPSLGERKVNISLIVTDQKGKEFISQNFLPFEVVK